LDCSIRTVRVDDAKSIVELLNPIIEAGAYTVMDEVLTVADQASYILAFPACGVFHVAVDREDDRRVLGLQSVEPVSTSRSLRHVGNISTFVHLARRGTGIGRHLTRATIDHARPMGFRKLIATIRADNPDALSFYSSQGFETIGTAREHALIRGRYVDEVLAERRIDQ